ncbi:MAG TPA: heavy metal translocating P-type ATPase [Gaiellaceae bacterium]|jgi:Cu+-exporting ATPase
MTSEIMSYSVPGVTCGHCRTAITNEVGTVAGVQSVDVDLEQKLVTIVGEGVSDAAVHTAIDEAGYDVAEAREDATGTVTEGKMAFIDVIAAEGVERAEALHLVGAIEHAFEHPIARAIAAAWDGAARAIFVVADTVKPSSAEAIAELKRLGLRPVLLTGDNETTARTVAAEAGIDDVIADVLPAGKAAVVSRLQEQVPSSRWSGTASTTPRRSRRPTSASLSAPARTSRSNQRPHSRLRRPARRGRRHPPLAPHARDDQGQPLLGLRLQRGRAAARSLGLPEPADRRRRDGLLQRLRRVQLAAPARLPSSPPAPRADGIGRRSASARGPGRLASPRS